MTDTKNSASRIDRWVIDPAFNLLEKVAVEAVKIPIKLIRFGVKKAVNGIIDLVKMPVTKINK